MQKRRAKQPRLTPTERAERSWARFQKEATGLGIAVWAQERTEGGRLSEDAIGAVIARVTAEATETWVTVTHGEHGLMSVSLTKTRPVAPGCTDADGDFLADWLDAAVGEYPDARVDQWAESMAEDDSEGAREALASFLSRFSVERLERLEREAHEALRVIVVREVA